MAALLVWSDELKPWIKVCNSLCYVYEQSAFEQQLRRLQIAVNDGLALAACGNRVLTQPILEDILDGLRHLKAWPIRPRRDGKVRAIAMTYPNENLERRRFIAKQIKAHDYELYN